MLKQPTCITSVMLILSLVHTVSSLLIRLCCLASLVFLSSADSQEGLNMYNLNSLLFSLTASPTPSVQWVHTNSPGITLCVSNICIDHRAQYSCLFTLHSLNRWFSDIYVDYISYSYFTGCRFDTRQYKSKLQPLKVELTCLNSYQSHTHGDPTCFACMQMP